MSTLFRIAALTALMLTAHLPAYAANCEAPLRARYKCSGTFSDGQSGEYCIRTDVIVPGDGQFVLIEEEARRYFCTCQAKGKAPDVQFGAASRDFFCGADGAETSLAARVAGPRITGHGYNFDLSSGIRSAFTCQAVETCP